MCFHRRIPKPHCCTSNRPRPPSHTPSLKSPQPCAQCGDSTAPCNCASGLCRQPYGELRACSKQPACGARTQVGGDPDIIQEGNPASIATHEPRRRRPNSYKLVATARRPWCISGLTAALKHRAPVTCSDIHEHRFARPQQRADALPSLVDRHTSFNSSPLGPAPPANTAWFPKVMALALVRGVNCACSVAIVHGSESTSACVVRTARSKQKQGIAHKTYLSLHPRCLQALKATLPHTTQRAAVPPLLQPSGTVQAPGSTYAATPAA